MRDRFAPEAVLEFWFPDTGHQNSAESHGAFWHERMQGGMDGRIIAELGPLTEAAARGVLDHWAETPRGRLALLIALDQFPRSLWRDTPGAYAQDIKATRLLWDGIDRGHADGLQAWELMFYTIANGHCEGPDHLDRLKRIEPVIGQVVARMPPHLAPMEEGIWAQHGRVVDVIERFGRHPHRNAILGRISTPDEEAYIATGDFPHLRKAEAS